MATEVAELYATLRIKSDSASWKQAEGALSRIGKQLSNVGSSLTGRLAALGAGFGLGTLVKKGLEFNSTIQDTKNQIAGMLSLAKKTDLADQIGNADMLMAHLQQRAKTLPGTTMEYAQMLGMLTQPLTDAGLGLKDLEDITVNSVVAAKALGVQWEVAARDIDQAIRGQFQARDVLTGKLLGAQGFKGEQGRARFNAMSPQQRAQAIKAALMQKQITQLAEAQGATASGRWSTFADTMQQTLGRVMAPLFSKLVGYLERVNKWLDANSAKVDKFASVVGGVLVTALEGLLSAFGWLLEHKDVLTALLIGIATVLGVIAAEAVIAAAPFYLIVAAVAAVAYGVIKLIRNWDWLKAKIGDVLDWIDAKLIWLGGVIMSPFIAIKDALVFVATTIYEAFRAVFDWIGAKLDWVKSKASWVWDKIKSVGAFVGGSVTGAANIADTLSAVPGVAGGAVASTASRAVPPPAGAPSINVPAPVVKNTINITGELPRDAIRAEIKTHNENMWRNIDASLGAEEQ